MILLITGITGMVSIVTARAGKVRIEKVTYKGWKNTYKLSNGLVEAYVLTDVGPRVIDFRPVGGKNVFLLRGKEAGKSREKKFVLRGGYRLWLAPEVEATTWFADNLPCKFEKVSANKIRVTGPNEPKSGVRKIIEVEMFPNEPRVRINQRIQNISSRPVEYSAWSVSVMRPGGRAFAPLHQGNLDAFADLRTLNLWSYADPADERYRFFNRFFVVDQTKAPARKRLVGRFRRNNDESKIGIGTSEGWVAYLNEDVLYIKRFPYDPKGRYPDNNSTVEIYSCEEFVECENLSPLTRIAPRGELVYPEEWYLFTGVSVGESEEEILRDLQAYLKKTKPVRAKGK